MGFLRKVFTSDPLAEFSNDEVQNAALRIIIERPRCSQSWIGGTVARCDEAINLCNGLRLKYAGVEPPRMRAAVMRWIDHFEGEARFNRRDCETNKSRRELDEYRATRDRESDRTAKLLDALHPQPQGA